MSPPSLFHHRFPMATPTKTLALLLLLSSLSISTSTSTSKPSLTVSPTTLTKSNNTVSIQWSGIDSPSDLDWLGIYSPPSSPDADFIGYLFLNASPTSPTGSGSISLPLANLRSDYTFRIFRWTRDEINPKHHDHDNNPLPGTKHRLAVSPPVGFGSAAAGPDQVHLAFTDRDDEMRVMFITGSAEKGFVRYGMEEGRLDREVGTDVRRYEREDMCDFPANSTGGWRDPGFIHDGLMLGLEMGKKHYYQVSFLDYVNQRI